jgi:recombination protein RecR
VGHGAVRRLPRQIPCAGRPAVGAGRRRPEALRVAELVGRGRGGEAKEVVLALPATVDGQTTAHYLAERLADTGVAITSLARGVPVGGDLDWLDDGTIIQALRQRRPA